MEDLNGAWLKAPEGNDVDSVDSVENVKNFDINILIVY